MSGYSEELVERLTAELDSWVDRCGGHVKLNNDLLAQHLVEWLSSSGRLVPEGSEMHYAVRRPGRSTVSFELHRRDFEKLRAGDPNWELMQRIVPPWSPAEGVAGDA